MMASDILITDKYKDKTYQAFKTPKNQPTSLEEGRGMLGYGRVDDVGISLKVSKVRTAENQRCNAFVWSCGDT